ncbi:uncharacterized protein [Littorina saxatilis]
MVVMSKIVGIGRVYRLCGSVATTSVSGTTGAVMARCTVMAVMSKTVRIGRVHRLGGSAGMTCSVSGATIAVTDTSTVLMAVTNKTVHKPTKDTLLVNLVDVE